MIRWLISFIVIILLGGCVQESQTKPEKEKLEDSAGIDLPNPKYLDISVGCYSSADTLFKVPSKLYFIGRLKQSVLDTCKSCNADKVYVELDEQLGGFELIRNEIHIDSINHIYAMVDSSFGADDLDSISSEADQEVLFLHLISYKGGKEFGVFNMYKNTGDRQHYSVILRNQYFEEFLMSNEKCLLDGITVNTDSLFAAVDQHYSDVNGLNTLPLRCFEEFTLTADSTKIQIDIWKNQLQSAKEYEMDTTFFCYMLSRWQDYKTVFDSSGFDKLSIAMPESFLFWSVDASVPTMELLEVFFGWQKSRLSAWEKKLKISQHSIPDYFMGPAIYMNNWLLMPSYNTRYQIIKDIYDIMEMHETNVLKTIPVPIPPPQPEPYIE